MSIFYNEFDPHAASWLRQLCDDGLIQTGVVDERSIEDLVPDELRRFDECHFFSGIGGWSYALRLAGYPKGRKVWTGSCPCQPFSAAGEGKGFADERHLWPAWFHLIDQLRPDTIFGEQVAGPDGETWFDLVSADLEGIGYAVGMAVLPSAGFGAPHGRHRIYFVAHSESQRRQRSEHSRASSKEKGQRPRMLGTRGHGEVIGMANPNGGKCSDGRIQLRRKHGLLSQSGGVSIVGNSVRSGLEGHGGNGNGVGESGRKQEGETGSTSSPSFLNGFWKSGIWIGCTDGKARSIEPGTFPVAYGVPARLVRIRGYGNAIVPQVAAAFIKSYLETEEEGQ